MANGLEIFEVWTSSANEQVIVIGQAIKDDPRITAAIVKLGQLAPFDGNPDNDALEADFDTYMEVQQTALEQSGVWDAVNGYFESGGNRTVPFNAIAVGGKAAVTLTLSESHSSSTRNEDALSDPTVRSAIDGVAGDRAAIVFPPVYIEDVELTFDASEVVSKNTALSGYGDIHG